MLMFGLGTLPAALGAGYLGLTLSKWLKSGWLGRVSGGLLVLMALVSVALGVTQL